jgi:hypothetical protein
MAYCRRTRVCFLLATGMKKPAVIAQGGLVIWPDGRSDVGGEARFVKPVHVCAAWRPATPFLAKARAGPAVSCGPDSRLGQQQNVHLDSFIWEKESPHGAG